MSYGYNNTKTTRDWVAIIRLDPCSYCGRPTALGSLSTIDHVVPFSYRKFGVRGLKGWSNLAPACKKCNRERGDQGIVQFLIRGLSGIPQHRQSI